MSRALYHMLFQNKSEIYGLIGLFISYIQPTIIFPDIGHKQIEQSHLPWENTVHMSHKYAGRFEFSQSDKLFVHWVHITANLEPTVHVLYIHMLYHRFSPCYFHIFSMFFHCNVTWHTLTYLHIPHIAYIHCKYCVHVVASLTFFHCAKKPVTTMLLLPER